MVNSMIPDQTSEQSSTNPIKRWIALALAVIVAIGIAYYVMVINRTFNVQVVVGDNVISAETKPTTVAEFLKANDIKVGKADVIEPSLDYEIKEDTNIKIVLAKEVTLRIGDEEKTLLTPLKTVSEVLAAEKVEVGELDKVEPALTSPIKDKLNIKITRVASKELVENFKVKFPIERRKDSSMTRGSSKVIARGEEGKGQKIIKVTYHNGKEVSREVIDEKVIKNPQKQVVAVGTRQIVSRGGKDLNFRDSFTVHASAYTHTGNRTATGLVPKRGLVATDPSVIPMGTKLYIEGYGYAVAADKGSAIKGKKVDLFFETYGEAISWGRRNVKLYVLED